MNKKLAKRYLFVADFDRSLSFNYSGLSPFLKKSLTGSHRRFASFLSRMACSSGHGKTNEADRLTLRSAEAALTEGAMMQNLPGAIQ